MKQHPRLKGSPNHPQEYLTHTSHIPFFPKFYNHLNIRLLKHRLFLQLKNQSHRYKCFLHSTESTIPLKTQNIILNNFRVTQPNHILEFTTIMKIILSKE